MFQALPPHHWDNAQAHTEVLKMLNRLTDSLDFQAQALTLRSERQRLIASNIANADTPGYVSRDFKFSSALEEATGQHSQSPQGLSVPRLQLAVSAHSTLSLARDGRSADAKPDPELNYATPSQTNLDSNTVDMDRERASFADNAVRYESALRFLNSQIKTLNTAITGQ
jgi:flagellar basal-body rod protein FlgB